MRPPRSLITVRMACSFLVALLSALAVSSAAQHRGVPRAARNAMIGCWHPWEGEQWSIRQHGATGLTIRVRTEPDLLRERFRVRGPRRGGLETISWNRDRNAAQVPCGPRTQHGQFCMVRPSEDGTLAVGVYARSHRDQSAGRLMFTATAEACR